MTAAARLVVETACAKINLYLHITAIRPDGYHELDSAFVFADFGDVLTFEAADQFALSSSGPFGDGVPLGEDNLVLRAARLFADQTGANAGAKIHLEKNLPPASGIGGGSADAAATLRGLNRLWKAGLTEEALAQLGGKLGADVPACVVSRSLQVAGIGDVLKPCADLPDCGIVLVNPCVEVPTGEIFRLFDAAPDLSLPAPLSSAESVDELALQLEARHNDLELPARSLAPVIGEVLDTLAALSDCRLARMSGSGATCFGLFDDVALAANAAERLAAERSSWWVAAGRLRH